ncbi:hypothetical protein [Nocardia aurantiaca]|uniref:Uncharacterized protein n=1 Tax=Nocardia aurantiaca TaxID=2675850 RepID=A0A6I3L2L9_9NOCA|nr:hypothetical protein [Nocardia aurantiaca]MTE15100.1 hypothetical protein [Nocardia aurantiaca]
MLKPFAAGNESAGRGCRIGGRDGDKPDEVAASGRKDDGLAEAGQQIGLLGSRPAEAGFTIDRTANPDGRDE